MLMVRSGGGSPGDNGEMSGDLTSARLFVSTSMPVTLLVGASAGPGETAGSVNGVWSSQSCTGVFMCCVMGAVGEKMVVVDGEPGCGVSVPGILHGCVGSL